MKEIRDEAERHRKHKLEKYGADHKACGGKMKAYAHGGKVEHPHESKDRHLAKEIKHEASELEHDHESHKKRAPGGPIASGAPNRLGRGRKGKTQVNVMVGKGGPDAAPGGMPPGLGAPPLGGAGALPPRPPMGAGPTGPMKRGGKAEHKKEHEHRKKRPMGGPVATGMMPGAMPGAPMGGAMPGAMAPQMPTAAPMAMPMAMPGGGMMMLPAGASPMPAPMPAGGGAQPMPGRLPMAPAGGAIGAPTPTSGSRPGMASPMSRGGSAHKKKEHGHKGSRHHKK